MTERRTLEELAAELRLTAGEIGHQIRTAERQAIVEVADDLGWYAAEWMPRPSDNLIASLHADRAWLCADITAGTRQDQIADHLDELLDLIDPPPPEPDEVTALVAKMLERHGLGPGCAHELETVIRDTIARLNPPPVGDPAPESPVQVDYSDHPVPALTVRLEDDDDDDIDYRALVERLRTNWSIPGVGVGFVDLFNGDRAAADAWSATHRHLKDISDA